MSLLGVLATFLALFVGVPRNTTARRAILAALVIFTALLAAFSLDSLSSTNGTIERLSHHLPLFGVAGLGLAVFLAAATFLAWRYPDWAMPIVIVLAPLRVALSHGASASNLLIPLYLVLLAITIAELVVRDRLRLSEGWRPDPVRIALAVMIAVVGISSLWVGQHYAPHTKAFGDALVKLFAFYLPFGRLYYVLYRYTSDVRRLSRLLTTFVGAGAVLAIIGIVQYPTHWVFVNRAGIEHDLALQHTFRANSLFWDPNIFGRFLAFVMLIGAALFLTARLRAAGTGHRRAMWFAGSAVALAAIAFVVDLLTLECGRSTAGRPHSRDGMAWPAPGEYRSARDHTRPSRGRSGFHGAASSPGHSYEARHHEGLEQTHRWPRLSCEGRSPTFERHPFTGVGLAGFPLAFPHYRTTHAASLALRDSHTTVVTVAAEQGLLGIAAFAGLLATFFATTLRKRRFGADRRLYLWQASLVACVLAVFIHSLTYNAFFEDPYMWVFMALASAVATRIAVTGPPVASDGEVARQDWALAAGERTAC